MTRYIIIAAGDMTRWQTEDGKLYLNTPKHFVTFNGERVIDRTVRLLKERGVGEKQIYVISKDYRLDGVVNRHPKLNKENYDADKFISSESYWDKKGRTVVLYGDVYFTDDAMDTILSNTEEHWRLFCRPTASEITGTEWGECFAISFYPADHEYISRKLQQLIYLYKGELLDRIGGWEWARIVAGVPVVELPEHKDWLMCYVVIDDETDDLDYPEDYVRLKKVVEKIK